MLGNLKRAGWIVGIGLPVLAGLVLLGLNWYLVYVWWCIGRVGIEGDTFVPSGKGKGEVHAFAFNTFDNGWLGDAEIEQIFDLATARMSRLTGKQPPYVIREDELGYCQMAVVWQLPSGYARLVAGRGNDATYVAMSMALGTYVPDGKQRPVARADLPLILRGFDLRNTTRPALP